MIGLLAVPLAWVLGAEAWSAAAALALLLVAGLPAPRPLRLGAAAAAPLLLSVALPLETVLGWRVLGVLVLAVLAWTPLLLLLGGRLPWKAVPWTVGAALVAVVAVLASPLGGALTNSDIAVRSQVLLLAAATLIVVAVAPYAGRRSA